MSSLSSHIAQSRDLPEPLTAQDPSIPLKPPGFDTRPPPGFGNPNSALDDHTSRAFSPEIGLRFRRDSSSQPIPLTRSPPNFTLSHSFPPPRLPYYRYVRYNHFSDRRNRSHRKSAYVLAIVQPDFLLRLGAAIIHDGIFLLPRVYDGTESGETCAILGLSRTWVRQVASPHSPLYEILRSCSALSTVPGIDDLSPYKLNVLRTMNKYINQIGDNEVVIFNVEPKGENGRTQQTYPCANICFPGGGMEHQDEYNWERTAFREFGEEVLPTGVKLSDEDIHVIARHRFTFADRQAVFFVAKLQLPRDPIPSPSFPSSPSTGSTTSNPITDSPLLSPAPESSAASA
jgi:hypothetical protein